MAKKPSPRKPGEKSGQRGRRVPQKDVEVLATLLVAYPQVSRAVYDPGNKALGLVFLCRGPMSRNRRKDLTTLYKDSVEVYLSLTGRKQTFLKASWESMDSFYSFQVERDVSSLSPGELDMTVDMICDKASVVMATEGLDASDSDEITWPARLFLQETIDQVKTLKSPRKLVALREGERVLVFDK